MYYKIEFDDVKLPGELQFFCHDDNRQPAKMLRLAEAVTPVMACAVRCAGVVAKDRTAAPERYWFVTYKNIFGDWPKRFLKTAFNNRNIFPSLSG